MTVPVKLHYLASLSGGKDSTAMILIIKKHKLPLDEIRFFDSGNWEHPEMREHIAKLEKYIKFPITIVKPLHTFDFYFGRKKTTGGNTGWGFPGPHYRWCTKMKVETLHKGRPKKSTHHYIGMAFDEKYRSEKLGQRLRYFSFPLIDYKITQKEALKICTDKGFDWNGLYKIFPRTGCWCCPWMDITSLKKLYDHRPKLWKRLLIMQTKSRRPFWKDGSKVEVFDQLFRNGQNKQ